MRMSFRLVIALSLCIQYAAAFVPLAPRSVIRRENTHRESSAGDSVTGTKFEEEDEEKNPDRRPGHQVQGMGEVDEETAAKQQRIRDHQSACQRLEWAEEIKTIMSQPAAFATMSTLCFKNGMEGFPLGSIVGFAIDDKGFPIFSFSGMSSHTKNVLKDQRASLCVTEPSFMGAADARVSMVGDVVVLKGEEEEAAKAAYLKSHPTAYWVMFGDFNMFRMENIREIGFVGGFARAGTISVEDYLAAEVDPCAAFAGPVMQHMNDDHSDSLKQYLQYLVGVGDASEIEAVAMKRIDRYGFDVRVTQNGNTGVLRIPFEDGPVTERKMIKDAIVNLSKKCAKIQATEAAEGAQ